MSNKTRIYFDFTRTSTVVEHGVCAVDVDDPTDDDEVTNALEENNFAFLQFLDREYDGDSWTWEEWDYSKGVSDNDDDEEVISFDPDFN